MKRKDSFTRRTCAAAACTVLLYAFVAHAAETSPAKNDNWASILAGPDAKNSGDAPADTGIVGMSSDELAALSTESSDSAEADSEVPDDFIRNRRRFVMRELKFNADWDTDPTSLPAFIEQYKRRTGKDAQALQPRNPLTFDAPDLCDWPFVFMTAHNAFTLSDPEAAGLKRYLQNGGFLHADDCLYGFPFGPAFHRELRKVFPEKELTPFNLETPNFGTLLKQFFKWDQVNEAGLSTALRANAFEYMDLDNRMSVLYTPPDLGCMWEISSPPTPTNPLGTGMHNMDRFPGMREAGYRIGINIVFYVMTH